MNAVAAERARIDAPEHAAWDEHRCEDCRPGVACQTRRALRDAADRADWRRVGRGGAR